MVCWAMLDTLSLKPIPFCLANTFRQIELRKARSEADKGQREGEYLRAQFRGHLEDDETYRFDMIRTQRLLYAGLTAFLTTVDWCAFAMEKRITSNIFPKPDKVNKSVHVLSTLNSKGRCGFSLEIEELSKLIKVRNCVVHDAGLLDYCKFESEVRSTIGSLDGIQISDSDLLGPSIERRRP
jgi:hypothetical protein